MKPNQMTGDLLALRASEEPVMIPRLAKCLGLAKVEDDPAEHTDGDIVVQNAGAVRIIQVRGIMARGVSGWFPWATDTEELEALLLEADDDETVTAIVLDVDSPGGTVNGTPEVANVLASLAKPVVAYVAGGMYSAAYYLAAASDMILARPSAGVGSVGVITAHVDATKAWDEMGLTIEVFRSGANKAPGAYNLSLSESDRASIQERIDAMGDQFREHVLTYRPEIDFDHLDGRIFTGLDAVTAGFADDTATGIKSAISTALALVSVGT